MDNKNDRRVIPHWPVKASLKPPFSEGISVSDDEKETESSFPMDQRRETNKKDDVVPELEIDENVHQQSVWWRSLPFLYDKFFCTPLPYPSTFCIPLPSSPVIRSAPQRGTLQDSRDPRVAEYYQLAVERARQLSFGSVVTHPTPPLDFLISSKTEVFILRVEVPVDPKRVPRIQRRDVDSKPERNKKKDTTASINPSLKSPQIEYAPPTVTPKDIPIGDFVSHPRGDIPSALGGPALLDIPNVRGGHLVRRTVGVPIHNAIAADYWVTPTQHVEANPVKYINPQVRGGKKVTAEGKEFPIWRCLVAVKTEEGLIYVIDPIGIMINPPPPTSKTRSTHVRDFESGGKHFYPYKGTEENRASKDFGGHAECRKRRSSLTDADLIEAKAAGHPLEMPLFDDSEMRQVESKLQEKGLVPQPNREATSVGRTEDQSDPHARKQLKWYRRLYGVPGERPGDQRTISHAWLESHRFTLLLTGLTGCGGSVIFGRTGGSNHCLCTYIIGCDEEGSICIWTLPCSFIVHGKYNDGDEDKLTIPVYTIRHAHSGCPINSLSWAGSLHPYYVRKQNNKFPEVHHFSTHHLLRLPESEDEMRGPMEKERTIGGYPSHLSVLSVGHDGALIHWYTKEVVKDSSMSAVTIVGAGKGKGLGDQVMNMSDGGDENTSSSSSLSSSSFSSSVPPSVLSDQDEPVQQTSDASTTQALVNPHDHCPGGQDSMEDEGETTRQQMATGADVLRKERLAVDPINAEASLSELADEIVTSLAKAIASDQDAPMGEVPSFHHSSSVIQTTEEEKLVATIRSSGQFDFVDSTVELKCRRFELQSIPLTAVAACPQSREFVLSGDWEGRMHRWSLSQLRRRQTRLHRRRRQQQATVTTISTRAGSILSLGQPQGRRLDAACHRKRSEAILPGGLLQRPIETYFYHTGPILKIRCIPSLPFIVLSVGFDRSIAFWDVTEEKRTPSPFNSPTSMDPHLLGIHGGHRLISVHHGGWRPAARRRRIPSTPGGTAVTVDAMGERPEEVANGMMLCEGGVVSDANWLSLALDLPEYPADQVSYYDKQLRQQQRAAASISGSPGPVSPFGNIVKEMEMRQTFGLSMGGASFGTALLSGVSVDDNNLFQIWSLSDDHFVTAEDNEEGRGLEQEEEGMGEENTL